MIKDIRQEKTTFFTDEKDELDALTDLASMDVIELDDDFDYDDYIEDDEEDMEFVLDNDLSSLEEHYGVEDDEEEIVLDDDLSDLASIMGADLSGLGSLLDNQVEEDMGSFNAEDDSILVGDEFKQFVLLQLLLQNKAEEEYVENALRQHYPSDERLFDKIRNSNGIMNPDNTLDGIFAADDYFIWTKGRTDSIVDIENDDTNVLQFMNDVFRAYPERCVGFSLPITEEKIYSNVTLLKLRERLVGMFEITRKMKGESQRQEENRNIILMGITREHDKKMARNMEVIKDIEKGEVVPVRKITYESAPEIKIDRSEVINRIEEIRTFTCGKCEKDNDVDNLFHQVNIFNISVAKKTMDVTPYKIERFKVKNSAGTGYLQQRSVLSKILPAYFKANKCEHCGTYNFLPLEATEAVVNYANKNQESKRFSLDTRISIAMDNMTMRPDVLQGLIDSYVEFDCDYKELSVKNNTQVTISDVITDSEELVQEYKNSLSKFKVMDRIKEDKLFQRFSIMKYITNSSSRGTISSDDFLDYTGKTVNSLSNTLIYKTLSKDIYKAKRELESAQRDLNNFELLDRLVNRMVSRDSVDELKTLSMDNYNQYANKICEGKDMFADVEDYQGLIPSAEFIKDFKSVKDNKYEGMKEDVENLGRDLASIRSKVMNPKLYKHLLVEDNSSGSNYSFVSTLGGGEELENFVRAVMSTSINNAMNKYLVGYLNSNIAMKKIVGNRTDFSDIVDRTFIGTTADFRQGISGTASTDYNVDFEFVKTIDDLCRSLKSKNYLRAQSQVSKLVPPTIDSKPQYTDEINALKRLFNTDNISEEYSKLDEVTREFKGVGFSLQELEDYFIKGNNEIPEVENYRKRREEESLEEYMKNPSSGELVDKPHDSIFLKAYKDNLWMEEYRILSGKAKSYIKGNWETYNVTSKYISILSGDKDWKIKRDLLGIDEDLMMTLCYKDLALDTDKHIKDTVMSGLEEFSLIDNYVLSTDFIGGECEVYTSNNEVGLININNLLLAESTYKVAEGMQTGLDEYRKFLGDVLVQLPKEYEKLDEDTYDALELIVFG